MNCAINPDVKTLTPAAKKIIEWKGEKNIVVINNKNVPTRGPGKLLGPRE